MSKYKRIVNLQTIFYPPIINLTMFHQHSLQPQPQSPKQTIANLIDSIDFVKKNKPKSTMSISDGDSLSSGHQPQSKEKSKVWTEQQIQLFHILLRKYGTDFHILSNFFPKKTKNQLKNRYKQYNNMERKKEKEEVNKFKAVSLLFKEVSQKEEKQEGQQNKMKAQ